ncbi:MAG TPA: hypothetical protein VHQ47_06070 [Phycisphaerae bacterium]|jgi:hypothetical protein|nr:hypothetical protein [Phycisphaerae bacterium]
MKTDGPDIEARALRLVVRIARLVRLEDDSGRQIHEKLLEILTLQFEQVRSAAIRQALKPGDN